MCKDTQQTYSLSKMVVDDDGDCSNILCDVIEECEGSLLQNLALGEASDEGLV